MRRALLRLIVVALTVSGTVAAAPAAQTNRGQADVVTVLSVPGLDAPGTPAGFDEGWVTSVLSDAGWEVVVSDGTTIPADTRVIVNLHGAAYPVTAAVEEALEAGTGWVNPGGLPFSQPDGQPNETSAEAHGLRASRVRSLLVTGSEPTELGTSLIKDLEPSGHDEGLALHAMDVRNERPLATYVDADFDLEGDPSFQPGIDITAGPALLLTVAPYRTVAAGWSAEDSPLGGQTATAAGLLQGMVHAALPHPTITSVDVTRADGELRVSATATIGMPVEFFLDGEPIDDGTVAAPDPWHPAAPTTSVVTARLGSRGHLHDLVEVPANPVALATDGDDLLLNGKPYVLTGMASGGSNPPGASPHEQAEARRWDLHRMPEVGVTSFRLYGSADDWYWNAAARTGLLINPAVGLGWIFGDSEAAAESRRDDARRLGADALGRWNAGILSVGNEYMDAEDPERMRRAITLLAEEIRSTNPDALVTYGMSHDEPWLLGEMPMLDVYSVNCYGASYPFGYPDPGFAHCIAHAKQFGAVDQPLVLGEWGANTWMVDAANMYTRPSPEDDSGDIEQAEFFRGEWVREKWLLMRSLGAAGGFAFQWSDGIGKCLFTSYHCDVTDPVAIGPDNDTGYRPLNHEKYWGFHDAWRNPRQALFVLEDIYTTVNDGNDVPLLP